MGSKNGTRVIDALRASDKPWVRLSAILGIDGAERDSSEAKKLQEITARDPRIRPIIDDCQTWPGYALKTHKDARHIVQKVGFLADIGLNKQTSGISDASKKLMARQSEDGGFMTLVLIPKVFGGSDNPEWQWTLCDFPLILDALFAFGYENDARVSRAAEFLGELIHDNGWRCTASVPKFKGPGKREHPCPFANLISLRALSNSERLRDSNACRRGVEMLLHHWGERQRKKYFLFGMGTDFKKLKYPFVWYDILHVVDVLSRFPWTLKDKRFQEMCDVVFTKTDEQGWYTPESIWMAYKGFDFCQKKETSETLTMAVLRIKKRLGLVE